MPVPFRIRCCRCGKNIPFAQDIYELDAEWQRRFPDMVGTLACHDCALRTNWICTGPDGAYVEGHIPAPRHYSAPDCIDAWSHVSAPGTHRARVVMSPRSGLLQGAEAYLRNYATRRGVDPETAAEVRAAIQGVGRAKAGAAEYELPVRWGRSGAALPLRGELCPALRAQRVRSVPVPVGGLPASGAGAGLGAHSPSVRPVRNDPA